MSADRYLCCDDQRRALLLGSQAPITGIDYIEVEQGATVADKSFIRVSLVKPLPQGTALTGQNFVIDGGVRFPAPEIDPQIAPIAGATAGYELTLPGGQPTDFSTYSLRLVEGVAKTAIPAFIDPRLATVEFSFKIDCSGDLDCAPTATEAPTLPPDPPFDYRTRDYQGFRRLMLDRLSALVPGFREDDPTDFTTALVEALAYRADQHSYRLDWVGTEAFLATARSRTSVTRHARLVDYAPGNGVSARTFVRFIVAGGVGPGPVIVPKSTPLLVRTGELPTMVPPGTYHRMLGRVPTVFETVADVVLRASHKSISFYTWGSVDCSLLRGATAATLEAPADTLEAGDFLVIAEIRSPETGDVDDARRDRRHVVRLTRVSLPFADPLAPLSNLVTVEWAAADALPFPLVLNTRRKDSTTGEILVCAEAWGNIALADHGASLPPAGATDATASALAPRLVPDRPVSGETWRPQLDRTDISWVAPVRLRAGSRLSSAAELSTPIASIVRPALTLDDGFQHWTEVPDLFRSSRFDRNFVVETGMQNEVTIRFGDGTNGLAPLAGASFAVSGRFGTGATGNIGADALAHVVIDLNDKSVRLEVTNPLPARGGAAPESLAAIRIAAPQAFRRQERAVTANDYAAAACKHPDVANAYAVPRWTGAWQTMMVYVDRKGGKPVDPAFRVELGDHLEHYRLMGFDVALRGAVPTPLDIELFVCALPDQVRALVSQRVRAALRPNGPADGSSGFFHPDNFTFGTPLYLSRLVAAVMAVTGVQSVTARKFQRWGRVPFGELAEGAIRPSDTEVLELADDPNFPERGRLTIEMGGGR